MIPAAFAVCGDGAAAVALGPVDDDAGLVASHLAADGRWWNNVGIEERGPRFPQRACAAWLRFYIEHARGGDVKDFFVWCMASVPEAVQVALGKADLTVEDIDWVCPHQNVKTVSGGRIARLCIPRARVVETRKEYGNVGPANVLLNLDRGAKQGLFRHGHHLLLFGQGSGMSVGAAVLRWYAPENTDQSPAHLTGDRRRPAILTPDSDTQDESCRRA